MIDQSQVPNANQEGNLRRTEEAGSFALGTEF
jgi:hypothetical protein